MSIITINIDSIATKRDSFKSEKEKFNNNAYNTFKTGYINTCGDPTVQSMKNNLYTMYKAIETGYNEILNYWDDFIKDYNSLENSLKSFSASCSNTSVNSLLSGMSSLLPQTPKAATSFIVNKTPTYGSGTSSTNKENSFVGIIKKLAKAGNRFGMSYYIPAPLKGIFNKKLDEVTEKVVDGAIALTGSTKDNVKEIFKDIKKGDFKSAVIKKSATDVMLLSGIGSGLAKSGQKVISSVIWLGEKLNIGIHNMQETSYNAIQAIDIAFDKDKTFKDDFKWDTYFSDKRYEDHNFYANLTQEINKENIVDDYALETETGKAIQDSSLVKKGSAAYGVSQGVGEVLGTIAFAAAGGGGTVSPVSLGLAGGLSGAGGTYTDAVYEGSDASTAQKAGTVSFIVNGVEWYLGGKMNEFNKLSKPIYNAAVQVGFDAGDGAVSVPLNSLVEAIYKKGYYDKEGNYIEFKDNDSYLNKANKLFKSAGGLKAMAKNAAFAASLSLVNQGLEFTRKSGVWENEGSKVKFDEGYKNKSNFENDYNSKFNGDTNSKTNTNNSFKETGKVKTDSELMAELRDQLDRGEITKKEYYKRVKEIHPDNKAYAEAMAKNAEKTDSTIKNVDDSSTIKVKDIDENANNVDDDILELNAARKPNQDIKVKDAELPNDTKVKDIDGGTTKPDYSNMSEAELKQRIKDLEAERTKIDESIEKISNDTSKWQEDYDKMGQYIEKTKELNEAKAALAMKNNANNVPKIETNKPNVFSGKKPAPNPLIDGGGTLAAEVTTAKKIGDNIDDIKIKDPYKDSIITYDDYPPSRVTDVTKNFDKPIKMKELEDFYNQFPAHRRGVNQDVIGLTMENNPARTVDYINQVKKTFPDLSDADALKLLENMNRNKSGLCSYAASLNTTLVSIGESIPDFKQKFGYDFSRINSGGYKVLNDDLMLIDLYCYLNENLVKDGKYIGGAEKTFNYIIRSNTTVTEKEIVDWLKTKGIDVQIDVKTIKNNFMDLPEDFSLPKEVTKELSDGNQVMIMVSTTDRNKLVLHMDEVNTKGEKVNVDYTLFGAGHFLTVIGMKDSDTFIVQSWGKRYNVKASELEKVMTGAFSVNSKIIDVSSTIKKVKPFIIENIKNTLMNNRGIVDSGTVSSAIDKLKSKVNSNSIGSKLSGDLIDKNVTNTEGMNNYFKKATLGDSVDASVSKPSSKLSGDLIDKNVTNTGGMNNYFKKATLGDSVDASVSKPSSKLSGDLIDKNVTNTEGMNKYFKKATLDDSLSENKVSLSHSVSSQTNLKKTSDKLVIDLKETNSLKNNEYRDKQSIKKWLENVRDGKQKVNAYVQLEDISGLKDFDSVRSLFDDGGTGRIVYENPNDPIVHVASDDTSRGPFDYRITLKNSSNITEENAYNYTKTLLEELRKRKINSRMKNYWEEDAIILYVDEKYLSSTVDLLNDMQNGKFGDSVQKATEEFGSIMPFSATIGDNPYYGISMAHNETKYGSKTPKFSMSWSSPGSVGTFNSYIADNLLGPSYKELLEKYNGDVSKITVDEIYDKMIKKHKLYMLGDENAEDIPLWMNRRNYEESKLY